MLAHFWRVSKRALYPFSGGRVAEAGDGFAGTGFRRMVTVASVTGGVAMWRLKLQTFTASLLRDDSGANAVEYALTDGVYLWLVP